MKKTLTPPNETHIATVRSRNVIQMTEVCDLLQWQPEQYCQHQFEQYIRFTDELAYFSEKLKQRLRYSDVFRGFWNNEWARRNANNFLPFAWDSLFELSDLTAEYIYTHDAIRLIHDDAFYNRFENALKLIK
jgi:hypothetical protein